MRYSLVAAELLLASSAFALIEFPVTKRDKHSYGQTADVARGVVKRSGTLETNIFQALGYVSAGAYYTNITVGTPPQLQTVLVDTGSSDLYLDARQAPACQSNGPHSCTGGEFVPSKSSTLKIVDPAPAFQAEYGDGSKATGPFAQDTVCVSDTCISNVQFGLATDVKSTVGPAIGLMGVGYSWIEGSKIQYPNMPEVLVDSGIINSRLYSLYLNEYSAATGSILFGGIDTAKYTGTLQTVDILEDKQTFGIDQFITAVTALKTDVGGKSKTIFSGGAAGNAAYGSNTPSLPVLLDSGSSAWSVPKVVYEAIVSTFSYVDVKNGVASCKHASSSDSVTITFNNQIDIKVGVEEFLIPIYDPSTLKPVTFPGSGEQACQFGIIPSAGTGEGFDTMGDAVLRSMYIVYDLDQGQMSLAQAKLNTKDSNIKVVKAGANGVKNAAGSSYGKTTPQKLTVAPAAPTSGIAFSVTKAQTTVGTATGTGAVPADGQVTTPSSASIVVPPMGYSGLCMAGLVTLMTALGAAMMM